MNSAHDSFPRWGKAGMGALRREPGLANLQASVFGWLERSNLLSFDLRRPPSLPSPSGGRSKKKRIQRLLSFPFPFPFPNSNYPFWLRRGAQGQADQGERLSERSEFELDPAWPEHRRGLLGSDTNFTAVQSTAPCGRAEGSANLGSDPKNPDADSRVAFLFLRFLWRSKEK